MDMLLAILSSRRRGVTPPEIVADDASNYATWTTGTNGGTGFGPWTITTDTNPPTYEAGNIIGDPAISGLSMSSPAFGLFAFPEATTASTTVARSLNTPLPEGKAFTFKWVTNFDASTGEKGFRLKAGVTTLVSIYQGNFPGDIICDTGVAETAVAGSEYGTYPMILTFARTTSTNLKITLTGRKGLNDVVYTKNITIASAPNNFEFYAEAMPIGVERYPYFDDFSVFTILGGVETSISDELTLQVGTPDFTYTPAGQTPEGSNPDSVDLDVGVVNFGYTP